MATTTRRDMLRLATSAAIVGGGIALPSEARGASPADHAIEQHWRDRARAYREFEADPHVLDDDDAALPYWDRIDAAEVAILAGPSVTARATEIRLWIAWSHSPKSAATRQQDTSVAQGDFAALRTIQPRLDWHEKMLFVAIATLRGETA